MIISNKFYDILKYISLIGLPALATFWTIVGAIWGAPHVDEVVKTIVALGTLLGALLILGNAKYNASDERFDGFVNVQETPPDQDDEVTHLHINDTVTSAADKGEVTLKVHKTD